MEKDQFEYERDEIIDELYGKVWALVDEINNLKSSVLEIGEEMKTVVSSKLFEAKK